MNQNQDEMIQQSIFSDNYALLQKSLIISSVVIAALFIGGTLFGKNSLEVYLSLRDNKKQLQDKIDKLQHKNAILQKQYFELKSLMPSKEDQ